MRVLPFQTRDQSAEFFIGLGVLTKDEEVLANLNLFQFLVRRVFKVVLLSLSNLARDYDFLFLFVLSDLCWCFHVSYLNLGCVFFFVVIGFLVFYDLELLLHFNAFASISCGR